MEKLMLHKPVTVLLLLFISFIHMTKYVNCSVCVYLEHQPLMRKPSVGAKLVLRFQALIAHVFLDRSIPFLYHRSACTSGSIFRKIISFISRFGTIVSHFHPVESRTVTCLSYIKVVIYCPYCH